MSKNLHGTACSLVIEQGLGLLNTIQSTDYTNSISVAYNASIGAHMRHCLEHFEELISGFETSLVDYDKRKRDRRVETELEFAKAKARSLIDELNRFERMDYEAEVDVRCRVMAGKDGSPVVKSTLAREAMYAVAHAIHHFALIKVLCELLHVSVPEGFGVAPSTLHYEASQLSNETVVAGN